MNVATTHLIASMVLTLLEKCFILSLLNVVSYLWKYIWSLLKSYVDLFARLYIGTQHRQGNLMCTMRESKVMLSWAQDGRQRAQQKQKCIQEKPGHEEDINSWEK